MSKILQLKIQLDHIRPSVYRTILVEDNCTLEDLHYIIQIAMPWSNGHLHQFEVWSNNYCIPELQEYMEDSMDASKVILKQVFERIGKHIKYIYDFGDYWKHTIKLEKILPITLGANYPTCLRGKRACPPEDSGGPYNYNHLKDVISDKEHPEYEQYINWLPTGFDPDLFDIDGVNNFFNEEAKIQ